MIYAHRKYEKSKKTRFLTIILTFENCDLWVDFVILHEACHGPSDCLVTFKTTVKEFSDQAKLSQTFAQRFMNSKTDFNETEILNNSTHITPYLP